MYRYFVFAFDEFYPAGGMGDCILKTNSLEEAKKSINENYSDSAYIYDVETDSYLEK